MWRRTAREAAVRRSRRPASDSPRHARMSRHTSHLPTRRRRRGGQHTQGKGMRAAASSALLAGAHHASRRGCTELSRRPYANNSHMVLRAESGGGRGGRGGVGHGPAHGALDSRLRAGPGLRARRRLGTATAGSAPGRRSRTPAPPEAAAAHLGQPRHAATAARAGRGRRALAAVSRRPRGRLRGLRPLPLLLARRLR